MQRIIKKADFVVEDMMQGFVKTHREMEILPENDHVVKYKNAPIQGKVGLVSGGGSGHEPAFLGYLGENMLDAVAVGEVFSSPPALAFYDAFIAADSGNGVICLFGNYAGDNMNVKMAQQMAQEDGVVVKTVIANDDVASSPKVTKEKRHGIAGGVFMWKIAGAKASQGAKIDEVVRVAQKAVDNTRSICVGLSACTIPDVGMPNFEIKDGTMEFGIGHHGEPGIEVTELSSADVIAKKMCGTILEDLETKVGDEVTIIVSGLGATPVMELYVLYDEIEKVLTENGVKAYRVFVGDYVTSLDMNGVALSVMKMDEELKDLLEVPAKSPGIHI